MCIRTRGMCPRALRGCVRNARGYARAFRGHARKRRMCARAGRRHARSGRGYIPRLRIAHGRAVGAHERSVGAHGACAGIDEAFVGAHRSSRRTRSVRENTPPVLRSPINRRLAALPRSRPGPGGARGLHWKRTGHAPVVVRRLRIRGGGRKAGNRAGAADVAWFPNCSGHPMSKSRRPPCAVFSSTVSKGRGPPRKGGSARSTLAEVSFSRGGDTVPRGDGDGT